MDTGCHPILSTLCINHHRQTIRDDTVYGGRGVWFELDSCYIIQYKTINFINSPKGLFWSEFTNAKKEGDKKKKRKLITILVQN